MAKIRTIEDGYQYRIHHMLNKIKSQLTLPKGMSFEDYLNTKNGKEDLADMLLYDIDNYCGFDEALENEY